MYDEESEDDMNIEVDKTELDETVLEDGDPPWRTDGHEYISRLIWHSDMVWRVVGWISDTDVDIEGRG